jgi:hypothetical protein
MLTGTDADAAPFQTSRGDGLNTPLASPIFQSATNEGTPTRDIWRKLLAFPILLLRRDRTYHLPAETGLALRMLIQWREDGRPDPTQWLALHNHLPAERFPRLTPDLFPCPEDRDLLRPWLEDSVETASPQD